MPPIFRYRNARPRVFKPRHFSPDELKSGTWPHHLE
jgi:hypothetical protein